MPPHAPTATQRVLHFILPVLFLTMSAVFLTVPYGMGQWPGADTTASHAAIADGASTLLACSQGRPDTFRGT